MRNIVWHNVIPALLVHLACLYSMALVLEPTYPLRGFLIIELLGRLSALGILAGAHRLWAHRSYKAKLSLRVVLMLLQTMALQNDIFIWVRDHRAHHKYSDTDADPHNSRRGFFFAHIGWLMMRKHPQVAEKGKTIDMSDVWADPVVRFQRRFYTPLVILLWGIVPTCIMHYFTNRPLVECFLTAVILRHTLSLHNTFFVNSAAHLFGSQPYNQRLRPRQNALVAYASMGEGHHNYHHAFPWDYSASEYGWTGCFNPATLFIDACALAGLAYETRKASLKQIGNLVDRQGDKQVHDYQFYNAKRNNVLLEYVVGTGVTFCSALTGILVRYVLNEQF